MRGRGALLAGRGRRLGLVVVGTCAALLAILSFGPLGVGGAEARPATDQYGERKVTICHKPNTKVQKTLTLPVSAAGTHVADHGDTVGPCSP